MIVYGKYDFFSSYRCCMCVSCVHPVAVPNAAFCMTCSLLMLVEDARATTTATIWKRRSPEPVS